MSISAFGPSSIPFYSLVILFIHSAFSLCFFFFWLPYFSLKTFGFSSIRLLVCFCVISSHLLVEFSFVVFEYHVLSALFYPCRYVFNLPSFANISWPISTTRIVIFLVLPFPFCLHVPASFLCFIILAFFFVDFFTCVSCRISYPGFDFFFVLFEGIPIFPQTNFAPA